MSVFLSFFLLVAVKSVGRLSFLLLLLSLLDVEGGWWRSGYTLLCLIMLMLQLTHHANHTVDGSYTSQITLVAHTICASHASHTSLLTHVLLVRLVMLLWLLKLFMLVLNTLVLLLLSQKLFRHKCGGMVDVEGQWMWREGGGCGGRLVEMWRKGGC